MVGRIECYVFGLGAGQAGVEKSVTCWVARGTNLYDGRGAFGREGDI